MHRERAGRMETKKNLRESCCHRIECPASNFLAAFMWKRSLNSAALTTITHRRLERVSDRTRTQVIAQTTNKWRIKIVPNKLYNVRDPWEQGDREIKRKTL